MSNIAIVGGGISGVSAAWQLHRLGMACTLYEASNRLGGTVKTVQRDGFTIELGPDGWVSEKPWAAELARDLGLGDQLTTSLDADRVTYILKDGVLAAMPDGMRMMVPTDLQALAKSPLFSTKACEDYAREPARAAELRASAPAEDESVASFVRRHFGEELLEKLAAPLLSGVFGGDVSTLSVQAVMPTFVAMEREHGSLITALQLRSRASQPNIFTTLASGTQGLIDGMAAELPASSVHLNSPVTDILQEDGRWRLGTSGQAPAGESWDCLILAAPVHVARRLLSGVSSRMSELLELEATSAVIAALAFEGRLDLPRGFGFLVPFSEGSPLLACTFVDQKFPARVPRGKRLLRAFFGGDRALEIASRPDDDIAELALAELRKILGRLPVPAFHLVERWPLSLPQYAVGHLERVAELDGLVRERPGLRLLGNAYRGVGLPDLVRDARALARSIAAEAR